MTRNRIKNTAVRQISLKRKVGYSEDEVGEARVKMSQMKID